MKITIKKIFRIVERDFRITITKFKFV